MIRAAFTVARKDLALFLRDRTALLLTFALPVVLAMIFGAALGSMGGAEGMGRVVVLVEDLDGSTQSRALVAEIAKSSGIEVKATTGARARVADGKAVAALLIPNGYETDLNSGREARLVLYRDAARTVEQQVVAGSLAPILMKLAGKQIGRSMMRKSLAAIGMDEKVGVELEKTMGDSFADGGDLMSSMPKALGLEIEDVTGTDDPAQKNAGKAHAVAGIAVMMLLFSLTAAGSTILDEEQQGTLQRLRLTPTASRALLLGKAIFTICVGLLQLVVLFAFGAIVFGLPVHKTLLALLVLSFAVASAATGLGLWLAVTCRSRKQLEGLSTLIILAMSALGGSWFPLMITPAWYQKLGHFTLNAWAMDGYHAILWYGKGLDGIVVEIGVLLAIALMLTLFALRGWNRRFEVTT
ncbi:MAG: ABC transporter permease [Planctomycetota bacterium]|nr:ABC transporter permease [Planctomycetota bacterium]